MAEPSLRHYWRAMELKRAGLDWMQALPLRWTSSKALLVARLRADPSCQSEEARARAFVAMGGGCRATYFNVLRRLRLAAPPTPVVGPESPAA
jgi:hypothetical protein